MSLKVLPIQGRNCPYICCDACGKPIKGKTNGMGGMAFWLPDDPELRMFHCHKGRCDEQLNGPRGNGRVIFWNDLEVEILYLKDNLGLSSKEWKDAEWRAGMTERM
jgi:hypothetical protein